MAGKGTRTQRLGKCKPAIVVAGKPILAWCLSGLAEGIRPGDNVITITTKFFEDNFQISQQFIKWSNFFNLNIEYTPVVIDNVLPGPAASVFSAGTHFNCPRNVIVVNSDQFIQFSIPPSLSEGEAFIPLYVNNTGQSSYVEIEDGHIQHVVEKQLVSYYASAGVYGFGSGEVLYSILDQTLHRQPHYHGEYFIGPAMNLFINNGGRVFPTSVIAKYDLGNVDSIEIFEKFINRFI